MVSRIEEIKRNSVLCKNGMLVLDKRQGTTTQTDVADRPRCAFCTKNGVLAFIDEHGEMYVTKWSSITHGILENEGYTRSHFQIPIGSEKIPAQRMQQIRYNAIFR